MKASPNLLAVSLVSYPRIWSKTGQSIMSVRLCPYCSLSEIFY